MFQMHTKCNVIHLYDEVSIHSDVRRIIISQQGRIKYSFDMTEHEICKKVWIYSKRYIYHFDGHMTTEQ